MLHLWHGLASRGRPYVFSLSKDLGRRGRCLGWVCFCQKPHTELGDGTGDGEGHFHFPGIRSKSHLGQLLLAA